MYKQHTVQILFAIFLMLVLASTGHAFSLTADKVQNFINSWDDVQEFGQKYDQELEQLQTPQQDTLSKDPFSEAVQNLKQHELFSEFENLTIDNGFSAADQWAQTGDRIMQGYLTLQMQEEQALPQMKQAVQDIEQSPLPEAQKKEMLQQVQHNISVLKEMQDIPEDDLELVRQNRDSLRDIFENY